MSRLCAARSQHPAGPPPRVTPAGARQFGRPLHVEQFSTYIAGMIPRTALLLVLAAAALGACGRPAPPPPGPGDPTLSELEALYRARQDSARGRYTAADVRFMTDMLHHHAQAVEMARLVPSRDASPSVQVLAARILSSQLDEIDIMRRWLQARGLPVPALSSDDAHGGHRGHEHAHEMPGMLSPAQMAELRDARGPVFERLFLTYMIEHHRGAVTMVRQLFATDGAAQDDVVFRFASDVQVDQSTEVARMERMLAALPPQQP